MVRKKWIIISTVVILVSIGLGYLLVYGLVDYDGDGIQNMFDDYPNLHNFPASSYAKEKIPSSEIIEKISTLDTDLLLDESEKKFIDYISNFDISLQTKLVDDFISDGEISFDEINQINFLASFSKVKQIMYIENGKFTNFDWDGDNMNNYFEKVIAKLSYDVYNGRYAILVDTMVDRKLSCSADDMYDFLVNEQRFKPENVVKLTYINATIDKFEGAVSNLESIVDKNSIFYVMLKGHGNTNGFIFDDGLGNNEDLGARLFYEEIGVTLDKVQSNATVITLQCCGEAGALDALKITNSTSAVLTMESEWIISTSNNYHFFDSDTEQYKSIEKEAYDADGNGYVSFKESFYTMMNSMGEYLQAHPDEYYKTGISDPDNIASKLYLGDFSVINQN